MRMEKPRSASSLGPGFGRRRTLITLLCAGLLLRGAAESVNKLAEEAGWQAQAREASIQQVRQWAANDGHILWTLANFSWRDFALNWVANVRAIGAEHWFIATLDDKLAEDLTAADIRCVALPSGLGSEDIEWGSDAFKARGREKIAFIRAMLAAGLQPLFSDLDVVWLRDPLPFVRNFPEANLLVSTDEWDASPDSTLDSCPAVMGQARTVEGHGTFVGKMNVGIHLLRPTALEFVEAWLEEMGSGEMEQLCWNRAFLRSMLTEQPPHDAYCRAMGGRIVAGLLPAGLFQNGLTFFVQRLPETLRLRPFAVHASFIGGTVDKVHHFREALLWHADSPERYGNATRLLALELDLPKSLLAAAGPRGNGSVDLSRADAAGHLRLIQQEYRQVQAAAELAKALGRSLVMPQLWCGLENLWMPHPGRLRGSAFRILPAPCPMSQLFHVHKWQADTAGPRHLPPLLESSFLAHPQTNLHHGSVLHVTACGSEQAGGQAGGEACCSGQAGACEPEHGTLALKPGLPAAEVLHVLKEHAADVRVLKLGQASSLWQAPPDPALAAAFSEVRRGFCCLADGSHVEVGLDEDIQVPASSAGRSQSRQQADDDDDESDDDDDDPCGV